jgi:ribosome biogenesis GTPase A
VDDLNLVSFLIAMADQGAPHAKESNLKGLRNRLKKMFRQGTPPSRSTLPPTVVAPPAVVASPATAGAAAPPADLVPVASTITTDPKEAARLRARYTHFRILVIGRANAGKTTLLKRVCNTKEDPVYSEVGYMCFTLYPTLIILSPTD